MMVKDPVSFCLTWYMIIQAQAVRTGRRKGKEEGTLKNSQKLHIPLSVKIHCPELGHVAPLATKKVENVVFILGGCEPL